MHIFIIIMHLLACVGLILIVLLQQGKGADLGAAFGGSSQTVFGSQGAGGFLTRLTTGVAVLFMFTSLGLAYLASNRVQATVMEGTEQTGAVDTKPAPAAAGDEAAPGQETPAKAKAAPTETPAKKAPQE